MKNSYTTNNLKDSLTIISLINKHDHFSVKGLINSSTFQSTDMNDVVNMLLESNLITIIEDDKILLTNNSSRILRIKNRYEKLLEILESLLKHINPPYMHDIYNGIESAKINMPDNVVKIFKDLGLFSKKRREVLFWWNKMKSHKRSYDNVSLSRKGLEGEFLIIDYEKERTGIIPKHISIDDDKAGYDILSTNNKNGSKKLLIEVKNSSSKTLRFFITKNEFFKCSKNIDCYQFYFIDSRNMKRKKLYKFGYNLLSKHIPKNQGLGKWVNIELKPDNNFLKKCKKYKL